MVNWGSAERERETEREREFAEQEEILQAGPYFMHPPQTGGSSAAFSGAAFADAEGVGLHLHVVWHGEVFN